MQHAGTVFGSPMTEGDSGTKRAIRARYPPLYSGSGGTCEQCRAKYLGTLLWEEAGFEKHPRQKHVSRAKVSIDILLNASGRSYTLSTAALLSFLGFPPFFSRSLISLSPFFFLCALCARRLLVRRIRSLVLGPAYQPISLRSSVFLALQSRHSACAGVKASMTAVPVAIVRGKVRLALLTRVGNSLPCRPPVLLLPAHRVPSRRKRPVQT